MPHKTNLIRYAALMSSLFSTIFSYGVGSAVELDANILEIYTDQAVENREDPIERLSISTEMHLWRLSSPTRSFTHFHTFLLNDVPRDVAPLSYYFKASNKEMTPPVKKQSTTNPPTNFYAYSNSPDAHLHNSKLYLQQKTEGNRNNSLQAGLTFNENQKVGPFSGKAGVDIGKDPEGKTTFTTSAGISFSWDSDK